MEKLRSDGYLVSDDRERIDIVRVHRWLSEESYWAPGISNETVSRSIQGAITLGCFEPDGVQVGVARLVTDGATFGWLTDVFVDVGSRGRGLGQFLVDFAMEYSAAYGLQRILLATTDAQDFYRRFGFSTLPTPERWMELHPRPTSSDTPARGETPSI